MTDEKVDEFYVRSTADYNAAAENELDLRAGDIYTIIDKNDSGWWYAIDDDGIDGWAPSSYVERLSSEEQIEMRELKEKQAEMMKETEVNSAMFSNVGDDVQYTQNVFTELKQELLATANSYAKRQSNKQIQFPSTSKQTISNTNNIRNTNNNQMWSAGANTPQTNIPEWKKRQAMERQKLMQKRMFFEQSTEEEKHIDDKYRPKFETINLNLNSNLANDQNRKYNEWNIDEILYFLIHTSHETLELNRTSFQLNSVIGTLAQKCKNNLNYKKYALKNNALNILLYVLSMGADKNVGISNSICRCITILCENTNMVLQYPCEPNAAFYLCTALRNSFKNPIFCCHALNCVANFVRRNPLHRSFILNDVHNQSVIYTIIEAMDKFRYNDEYHIKNIHCSKVQVAGCLALQNLAMHEKGQKLIGEFNGVEAILDGFIAHIENEAVVAATLGALMNVCVYNKNATQFLECDGLQFFSTFLENPETPPASRIIICNILQNMVCDPFITSLLIDNHAGYCESVVIQLISNAEYGSVLYLKILKWLNTLLIEINTGKLEFMKDLLEQKFMHTLIDALEYEYGVDENTSKTNVKYYNRIMQIYDATCVLFNIYYDTNDEMCIAFVMDETENENETWIPHLLVTLAVKYQSTASALHMVWQALKLFNACTENNIENREQLIHAGIIDLLFNTQWYTNVVLDPEAIKYACNLLLKFLQSYNPQLKKIWDIQQSMKDIQTFLTFVQEHKPDIARIYIKKIEHQMKYI